MSLRLGLGSLLSAQSRMLPYVRLTTINGLSLLSLERDFHSQITHLNSDYNAISLLISEILQLHKESLFGVSHSEVGSLIKEISSDIYSYSPLKYDSFKIDSNPKDDLFRAALSRVLIIYCKKKDFFLPKCDYSVNLDRNIYTDMMYVVDIGKVYQIHFEKTLFSLNKRILLNVLINIIRSERILKYIVDFIHLSVNEFQLINHTYGIPPIGLLSSTLLNIYLTILDNEVARSLYDLAYFRNHYEAYLIIPNNYDNDNEYYSFFNYMEHELHIQFDLIMLTPGSEPIPCIGGLLSLNNNMMKLIN